MKINFVNLPAELEAGAKRVAQKLGLSVCTEGIPVTVTLGKKICVQKNNNGASIVYKEKIHFFRALGTLSEHLKKGGDFTVEEEPQFDTVGIMPDLSSRCVMKVETLFDFMDYMAIMGLNMLLMYMEDLYEVPGRKYFGHMRGRYTNEELKMLDDYAFEYGIEVIPCMQTLGHMGAYLVWPEAADVKETASELNVDKEETYKFIEDMILASMSQFRTKRIHIGMDEAWGLGRSEASLKKYGARSQVELFVNHLQKVAKICEKHGYSPMIWNDFIYCLHSKGGMDKYNIDTEIPKDIIDRFPKNVQLVYWHYGEEIQGCDDYMIEKYKEFDNDILFAGGLFMWTNALPDNMLSFDAAEEGLLASKKHGLKEVLTTLWCEGSRGCDCINAFLHLQQYAEHAYYKTITKEHLKARFEACTGANYDAFMNMSQFGNIMDGREYPNYLKRFRGQKFMLQDVFPGNFDFLLKEQKMSEHYAKWADYYKDLCDENDKWYSVYNTCRLIFDFLDTKTFIAENLRDKYLSGDKAFLVRCEKELFPLLLKKNKLMHANYRKTWFETKKAFGFEGLEQRLGTISARIETAIERLSQYNNGYISTIEELDEPQLPVWEDYYN